MNWLDWLRSFSYFYFVYIIIFYILIAKDQIILRKLIDLNVEHNAELKLYDVLLLFICNES